MSTVFETKVDAGQTWRATTTLRWAYAEHLPSPPMLQQMFVCVDTGETQWRELPVVNVPGFDTVQPIVVASFADAARDFICGDLTIRPNNPKPLWKGVEVPLTGRLGDVVKLLASDTTRFFTYREMYDVYRFTNFQSGDGPKGFYVNVRTAIKRIRREFEQVDPTFDRVEVLFGTGYRWRT